MKKYILSYIIKLFILTSSSLYCYANTYEQDQDPPPVWVRVYIPFDKELIQGLIVSSFYSAVTKDIERRIQILWLSKDLSLWRGFILPYDTPLSWVREQISNEQMIKLFNYENYYLGMRIDKNGEITTDYSDFS